MDAETPTQRTGWRQAIAAVSGSTLLATSLILGLAGCQTSPTSGGRNEATARQVLLQTDSDFCALAQKRGVAEAFCAYAAEDATLLPQGENPVHGRGAIFATMSEGPKYELDWSPEAEEVAHSGDLGYTWGKSVVRRTGDDGKPIIRHGKYLTVWKRQSDGSWKYVMDIGNPSPPPQ